MQLRLGVDIACRTAHQASLADERGEFIWSGRSFRTSAQELERLWSMLPATVASTDVTVAMEPTRNAWVPLAAWFRRRGATVVLVLPERAADLRAYDAKHTKSGRLDSRLLARLPLLHPDGLHAERGLGPGDALRRAKVSRGSTRSSRSSALAGLPPRTTWGTPHRSGSSPRATPTRTRSGGSGVPGSRTSSRVTPGVPGARPRPTSYCGQRLTRSPCGRASSSTPTSPRTSNLEARLALQLTAEIKELDERIGVLLARVDPAGIVRSVPGVGAITAAAILGRLGDPARFSSLAAARSFTGLVPSSMRRANPAITAVRRNGATPSCVKRSSWPPITPGASTPHWRRATTG